MSSKYHILLGPKDRARRFFFILAILSIEKKKKATKFINFRVSGKIKSNFIFIGLLFTGEKKQI